MATSANARCEHTLLCAIIQCMKFPGHTRRLRKQAAAQLSLDLPVDPNTDPHTDMYTDPASPFLKAIGWISAGMGAVALGMVVGFEIRQRYRFSHRTPYDRYAHAGASLGDDFGIGI